MMKNDVGAALHRLGIYENSQGFYVAEAVVSIALHAPESLLMVTKWLYPEAAKQCGANWQALEKNLRVTVARVWEDHPERLQALSAVPLKRKPTVSRFVALVASSLSA